MRNGGSWCRSVLGVGLLLAAAATAAAEDEPARTLAAAKAAMGGPAWDGVRTLSLRAHVATSGLEGELVAFTDVRTGRYVDRYRLGPAGGGEGFDGATAWSEDSSGRAHAEEGEARSGAIAEAYRRACAFWFAERRAGETSWLGERRDGDRLYAVVRMAPLEGRAFEAWFDRTTGVLARTVENAAGETRTTVLADYRPVVGVLLPFAVRVTNGDAREDQQVTVTAAAVNAADAAEASYAMPAPPADDFVLAGGATAVTVPFELVNNHIYVRAEVDGREMLLLCDTGGLHLLRPEAARRLGLRVEGAVATRGVGEAKQEAGYAEVGSVVLGGATIRRQVFAVMDLARVADAEGVDFDGLLGHELFKRFVVRIDYPAARLTLTLPGAFSPPAGAVAVPFTLHDGTPQVAGAIDGIAGRFDLDTGSRSTVDLLGPFVDAHGLRGALHPRYEGATGWGVGGASRSQVARARRLELGGVAVDRPVVLLSLQKKGSFADATVAGNVGGGVLRQFVVTFDDPHQVVYFERPSTAPAPDEGDFDRSGMWLNRSGAAFEVMDVYAGGPAAEAGLRVGDRVLAVDGRAATAQPLAELRRRLRTAPEGATLDLQIERRGVRSRVTLRPRPLV